jgi:hypothetical protein
MIRTSPCGSCKHFRLGVKVVEGQPTCDAFPDGIPDEILFGRNRHREPYPGDHGIQHEPIDDEI